LIEYKQEAYSMFVDLMADIYNTFTERFLRAQIVFQPPAPPPQQQQKAQQDTGRRPKKRYNALGVLEDIPEEEPEKEQPAEAVDSGPAEYPPSGRVKTKADPAISAAGAGSWSNVGRNDPCRAGPGRNSRSATVSRRRDDESAGFARKFGACLACPYRRN